MFRPRMFVIFALPILASLMVWGGILRPASANQDGITLMATLAVWQYPGSTMAGASMSDGGNPAEPEDIACKAVFTTTDSFEQVTQFFEKKTGEGAGKEKETQAVMTQDNSKNRPVSIRIFSIHRADRSNILVVSRAENEKQTHIAWSQYRRLAKR